MGSGGRAVGSAGVGRRGDVWTALEPPQQSGSVNEANPKQMCRQNPPNQTTLPERISLIRHDTPCAAKRMRAFRF